MKLSNGPVLYSLLVLYMPLTILISCAVLLGEFLRELLPQPFPLYFPIISGIAGTVAASFYCDLMQDTKSSHTAATIRGAIIITALSYLLSSPFRRGIPWGSRFLPGLPNITASLGAFYAWGMVIALKKLFSARRRFDEYTELYQGGKLQEALFGESSLLEYTDTEIVTNRRNYLLQLILTGMLLLFNTLSGNSLPLVMYILLICVLESGICITGFLGIFRREQYYAGEGLVFSPLDRMKCMLGMGIFSALCIACALLLSSDKNLLSISLIIDFFKWLFGLLRRPPPPRMDMILPDVEIPLMPIDMEPLFPITPEEQKSWPIWAWLRNSVIALAAAVFLWFMISPLFNRSVAAGRMSVRRRLGRIISEWFRGLLYALRSVITLIRNDKSRQKLHKPGAAEILRAAEAIAGAYSHAKRRDIRHSVTLFARLIIWGAETRNIIWKPSHAPGEYCAILATAVPLSGVDHSAGIIRCGGLFEQALYSAEVLSDAERREFRGLIEEITGS